MIARFWTAKIAKAHAPAYANHLKSQVLTTLRKVDGYVGAKLLERETSDGVEIVVVTLWESLDSIKKFAGPDLEKAVVSDDIVSLFLQYDKRVRHYKVILTDDPQHT
jgi:heme-degrading monooxygenase HmoA